MMLPMDQTGVLPNSQSPKIAEDGAVVCHAAPMPLRLDGQYCTLLKIVFAQLKIGRGASNASTLWRANQYRATTMIAKTMNAAKSERARSNHFDRCFTASG